MATFSTVRVEQDGHVAILSLNRPSRFNSINDDMFRELPAAIEHIKTLDDVRVVILRGEGKHFCTGLDLNSEVIHKAMASLTAGAGDSTACPGRERLQLMRNIKGLQKAIDCFEECPMPVIAAVKGYCIGGGVDIITACDIRYCTSDAVFSVKVNLPTAQEVDVGITADLGSLQRLPLIVGHGLARELALTARDVDAAEALRVGLVTAVHPSEEALLAEALKTARALAAKSPLAVQGTKATLLHARDHSVADGLEYVAARNAAVLFSRDLEAVFRGRATKKKVAFSKL